MAIVTRSIHPLPFENLDPNRFEDLIRQLAYDFRDWISLEATGRSGSDSGYDIRGLERTGSQLDRSRLLEDDDAEEAEVITEGEDRLWLIQCKREKEIGPTKLGRYIDAIPSEEKKKLYGVIVAASCDISKKARDTFLAKCREAGISECYIWSGAELENMLFQPKNDGILFAYFGISLILRRRSVATKLRSKLAIKRKLIRAFGGGAYISQPALFLDPEDESYPFRENRKINELNWRVLFVTEFHSWGIEIAARKIPAFLDDDGIHWDMADVYNDISTFWRNPWIKKQEEEEHSQMRREIYEFLDSLPQHNRAHIDVNIILRFEEIIDVDKDGDPMFNGPTIYVAFQNHEIPYYGSHTTLTGPPLSIEAVNTDPLIGKLAVRKLRLPDQVTNRIEKFPSKFRRM